jgi:hypothetical protein
MCDRSRESPGFRRPSARCAAAPHRGEFEIAGSRASAVRLNLGVKCRFRHFIRMPDLPGSRPDALRRETLEGPHHGRAADTCRDVTGASHLCDRLRRVLVRRQQAWRRSPRTSDSPTDRRGACGSVTPRSRKPCCPISACSGGSLLAFLRDRGWTDAIGVDLSEFAVERLQAYGFEPSTAHLNPRN